MKEEVREQTSGIYTSVDNVSFQSVVEQISNWKTHIDPLHHVLYLLAYNPSQSERIAQTQSQSQTSHDSAQSSLSDISFHNVLKTDRSRCDQQLPYIENEVRHLTRI